MVGEVLKPWGNLVQVNYPVTPYQGLFIQKQNILDSWLLVEGRKMHLSSLGLYTKSWRVVMSPGGCVGWVPRGGCLPPVYSLLLNPVLAGNPEFWVFSRGGEGCSRPIDTSANPQL